MRWYFYVTLLLPFDDDHCSEHFDYFTIWHHQTFILRFLFSNKTYKTQLIYFLIRSMDRDEYCWHSEALIWVQFTSSKCQLQSEKKKKKTLILYNSHRDIFPSNFEGTKSHLWNVSDPLMECFISTLSGQILLVGSWKKRHRHCDPAPFLRGSTSHALKIAQASLIWLLSRAAPFDSPCSQVFFFAPTGWCLQREGGSLLCVRLELEKMTLSGNTFLCFCPPRRVHRVIIVLPFERFKDFIKTLKSEARILNDSCFEEN